MPALRILNYGPSSGNSLSRVRGMQKLGHHAEFAFETDPVESGPRLLRALEWRVGDGPLTRRLNRELVARAVDFAPDILWVEKGKLVFESTLATVRRSCGARLVNTYSDDFLNPQLRSRHYARCIPLYDFIFTPREINFAELRRRGAQAVGRFWKGYDPDSLYPESLTPADAQRFESDVVFVGHAEQNRIETLNVLAREVAGLKIWGYGWERFVLPEALRPKVVNRQVLGEDYRKALCGAKIALHFLSRWNRDTHSSRTFEVPACGVLMLAERSADHLALFDEDREAVFFSDTDELVAKVKLYLRDDAARRKIAEAGRRRCLDSGYSNHERIREMLEQVVEHKSVV